MLLISQSLRCNDLIAVFCRDKREGRRNTGRLRYFNILLWIDFNKNKLQTGLLTITLQHDKFDICVMFCPLSYICNLVFYSRRPII